MDTNFFINSLESYIERNPQAGIWKNLLELEEITGFEVKDIIKNINKIDTIKQNSKDEYTTINLYNKYTKFWRKFLDGYIGYIR